MTELGRGEKIQWTPVTNRTRRRGVERFDRARGHANDNGRDGETAAGRLDPLQSSMIELF